MGGNIDSGRSSVNTKVGGFDWEDGDLSLGYSRQVSEDGEYFFCVTAEAPLAWRMKALDVNRR